MEKSYTIRGVRKMRAFWGECIVCTIYLGNRQIGTLKDCPDSGKPVFEFTLQTDKLVFESFIKQWWTGVQPFALYDQNAQEFASNSESYSPSMPEKMRYWIKSTITAALAECMKIAA